MNVVTAIGFGINSWETPKISRSFYSSLINF
ncbi:hypothetical protein [Campylobacter phage CJLB-12]|nr:hypothetical protein [Campylobacter phage CJLB-12]